MGKKIAIITATRAEYGLLKPLIEEMIQDDFFESHVVVTGTHLLKKYGETIKFIKEDNIPINYKVPIIENENNQCETIANALIKFGHIYEIERYDAIIVLGDRYELYGFCIPALLMRIPIVHIHGGERTEGAIDEKIRHSITKMSSIHFASIPEYAKRIVQMGESPEYVFCVGALGIDNILKMELIEKSVLEQEIGVNFDEKIALVTFHPVTLDDENSANEQINELFAALQDTQLKAIITMPNSDRGGEIILKNILDHVNNDSNFKFYRSLGQARYLSCLKYCSIVIGNSSSGIIETASFNTPTVDIGDRQKGRLSPENVIHCKCNKHDICKAIEKGLSREFKEEIQFCVNPYGCGDTAIKIKNILKSLDWMDERLIKKQFFDLDFEVM